MGVFPQFKVGLFSETEPGTVALVETRSGIEIGIVTADGSQKTMLLFRAPATKYIAVRMAENTELVIFTEKARLRVGFQDAVSINNLWDSSALGFVFGYENCGVLCCSAYDGFDNENIFVRLDNWQRIDGRPKVKVGSASWSIELLDRSISRGTSLVVNKPS